MGTYSRPTVIVSDLRLRLLTTTSDSTTKEKKQAVMKILAALVLFSAVFIVTTPAEAASPKPCSSQLTTTVHSEDLGKHDFDAKDWDQTYIDYKYAVSYRDECFKKAAGVAQEWNLLFLAQDCFLLGLASRNTDC
jgi:hypothetical protein